jgi:aryl-alcohol dehydrogenase-like predicted oxidoreductase
MQYRVLGRTGFEVSTVSFGAWAIGGTWGTVNDDDSRAALHRAVDCGINFFDTADVYGDGRSERLIGELVKARSERLYVATKAGRRLNPHVAGGFSRENLTAFVERSLKNLGVEALDLLQLHCPPPDVYYTPEVFGVLDDLVTAGKIQFYGVSIERVEEGLKAIEYPNVQSLQLIYNVFRQRPEERLFPACLEKKVGILARVPLASGLLTGKLRANTEFEPDDHRHFNRNGEAFDVGETFAGIPYELGLELVSELRTLVPEGVTMAKWALRYILMQEAVTCTIPGAKTIAQVDDNAHAADLPALSPDVLERVRTLYQERVRPLVHQRW